MQKAGFARDVAEVPLTDLAVEAFRDQMKLAGVGPYLFPSDLSSAGHQTKFRTAWAAALLGPGSGTSS